MKYDSSLIETSYVKINGKKVKIEKIPQGMSGPNGSRTAPSEREEDDTFEGIFPEDPVLYKEYTDYVEEGIEPDSDKVRAIKEEIEKEQSEEILDTIDLDEEAS